jgi:hypothetical protein
VAKSKKAPKTPGVDGVLAPTAPTVPDGPEDGSESSCPDVRDMIPRYDDHPVNSDNQKELFLAQLEKIAELGQKYNFDFNCSTLADHVGLIIQLSNKIKCGLSNPDDLMTITDIEGVLSKFFTKQYELTMIDAMNELQNIGAEKELISKKKLNTESKVLSSEYLRAIKHLQ